MGKEYDIIIIGGGATGAGLALDATLRGYKTLIVDKDDFASKSSSNSTKLVHGGVRYLEKAFLQFSWAQLKLVIEALQERYYFLKNAKNLTTSIPLNTQTNSWFERWYLFAGLKLYDLLSFSKSLGKSEKTSTGARFYDGSFNDARMVIALLQTAKKEGCTVKNYQEVIGFIYEDAMIKGIKVHTFKGKEKTYHANCIINATGIACDILRQLDYKKAKNLLTFSRGSHIVLPHKYLPKEGQLLFTTPDKRVIFMLPWQGYCLVGTTEIPTKYTSNPRITKKEIQYLLHHINTQLNLNISANEITSSFSGLRPLIQTSKELSDIVREHIIDKSASNLVSITAGKWTTYRHMAQECLDFCVKQELIEKRRACVTHDFQLIGNNSDITSNNLNKWIKDGAVCQNLIDLYGDQCYNVLKYKKDPHALEKIHENHVYIKAELLYSMKYEFVKKPLDFLFRRIPIGKVNLKATKQLLKPVVQIMSFEQNWDEKQTTLEYNKALKEINELLQSI